MNGPPFLRDRNPHLGNVGIFKVPGDASPREGDEIAAR